MKLVKGAVDRAVARPDSAIRFYLFHGAHQAGSRHLAARLLKSLGAEKFSVPGAAAKGDPAVLADEASAMEWQGLSPRLVPGSSENFKITQPEDFALAEAVLRARRKLA